jgi:hypothetical protein
MSLRRVCLCDHPESDHVQGKRCHGTVYDVVGNYSCHCDEYVENAVCACGLLREEHRYRREKEPGGTFFGGCHKFVPYTSTEHYIRIYEKPVVIGASSDNESVEQDATSIRFSLLELD